MKRQPKPGARVLTSMHTNVHRRDILVARAGVALLSATFFSIF